MLLLVRLTYILVIILFIFVLSYFPTEASEDYIIPFATNKFQISPLCC